MARLVNRTKSTHRELLSDGRQPSPTLPDTYLGHWKAEVRLMDGMR